MVITNVSYGNAEAFPDEGFRDQVDCSNWQTTSLGNVMSTGECFSWSGSDDYRAKIEPPSCRQYKSGDFLALRPLNWDEIINEDDDDENWGDPGAPSSGRSCPSNGCDNHNGEGKEHTQIHEKGTGERKGTQDGEGKGKVTEDGNGTWLGKGKRNGNGLGIVEPTPGGDDISRAVSWQLQKKMCEANSDTEG